MRILIKRGVLPRSLIILAAAANTAHALDLSVDVTITSGTDGAHRDGSKHYTHEALDIRSKNFPDAAAKRRFLQALLTRLGPRYQGLLEHEGEPNEHFHVEYDPD